MRLLTRKLLLSAVLVSAFSHMSDAMITRSVAATNEHGPTSFSRTSIKEMVIDEAQNSLVPPALALALAKVHSDFRPDALGTRGTLGVMQVATVTAEDLGISEEELWEPRLNIQIALDQLGEHFRHHGSWDLALAAYHGDHLRAAGLQGGGVEGVGRQAKPASLSENFVASVIRWRDRYDAQATVWAALDEAETDFMMAENVENSRDNGNESSNERPELTIHQRSKTGDHTVRSSTPGKPSIVIWYPPQGKTTTPDLDHIETIEDRLAAARRTLDDFGSIRVPAKGRVSRDAW